MLSFNGSYRQQMFKQKAYYECLTVRHSNIVQGNLFILCMDFQNQINRLFYVHLGIKFRVYLERITNGR
jgi:hypothetical protein